MLEIIWRFHAAALTQEAQLSALLAMILELPGISFTQYDLNQKDLWRRFDLERAVVDALTQRTQLLTLRGEAGVQMLVALGKHGEQPTAIVQWPDGLGQWSLLEQRRPQLYEALPVASTILTSPRWRQALHDEGLLTDFPDELAAMSMSWQRDQAPAALRHLDTQRFADSPVRHTRAPNFSALRLAAPDTDTLLDGPRHLDALRYLAARFREKTT